MAREVSLSPSRFFGLYRTYFLKKNTVPLPIAPERKGFQSAHRRSIRRHHGFSFLVLPFFSPEKKKTPSPSPSLRSVRTSNPPTAEGFGGITAFLSWFFFLFS